jgi:HEAT repeat protein
MKHFHSRALLFLVLMLPSIVRSDDAQVAVEALKKVAQKGNGITQEESAEAGKVQSIGATAIPHLIPLLRDKDEDIRALAAYTVRDIEGLTEKHLDALIECARGGEQWIIPAIGSIGSPLAIEFLVSELVRERSTGTQVVPAVERLGGKVVPHLVKLYEKDEGWDESLELAVSAVLTALGKKAAGAIEPLLNIAGDESAPFKRRGRAIEAIGHLGQHAAGAVRTLQLLHEKGNADIQYQAMWAIIGIGTPEATPFMVQQLKEAARQKQRTAEVSSALLRTAWKGIALKAAGSEVASYLKDPDGELRAIAAGVLGHIGYDGAADDLISLLDDSEDWRVAYSAAGALGLLKIPHAEPALARASIKYWYPPVRHAAATAIKTIHGEAPPKPNTTLLFGPLEFLTYDYVGKDQETLNQEDLPLLRHPVSQTPNEVVPLRLMIKQGVFDDASLPAVKLDDGWLTGTNLGEWGGEILFKDLQGNVTALAQVNTEAVYLTDKGPVAVTGLAHMTSNYGRLYRLRKNDAGKWTAEPWRVLPGAPIFSRKLEDGNLLINCHGGIVLVSPDGTMKTLTRKEALRDNVPETR